MQIPTILDKNLLMRINLLKTAAGLQEIDQLIERQSGNKVTFEGKKVTYAYTRYMPKRAAEIIASEGSIYWIMKNRIQVRQRILGFKMAKEEDGFEWCMIIVEPRLYQTYSVQKRAIQGWRYLEETAAPKDRGIYTGADIEGEPPAEMAEELKKLGLL